MRESIEDNIYLIGCKWGGFNFFSNKRPDQYTTHPLTKKKNRRERSKPNPIYKWLMNLSSSFFFTCLLIGFLLVVFKGGRD